MKLMNAATFSSRIACDLIAYVRQQGQDVTNLYELISLPETQLNREDIRIPSALMSQIWQKAMAVTEDEDVGFHMGLKRRASALRTTSLIMQSSTTVYEAFEQGIKYSELIANVLAMKMEEDADNIYIEFTTKKEWSVEPVAVVKDCLNLTFYSMLISVQQLTGNIHPPSIVCFSYPKPKNINEYYQAFNCHVNFSQSYNRIGFSKSLGGTEIATRDQGLLSVLEQYASEIKQSFSSDGYFVLRVQKLIIEMMNPQPPSIEKVAKILHLSSRSLQRKIKAEKGLTYKQLVDETRKKLCAKYMEDPQKTVNEISLLVGYTDVTSFVRAFKRWHGKTLRQMRSSQKLNDLDHEID